VTTPPASAAASSVTGSGQAHQPSVKYTSHLSGIFENICYVPAVCQNQESIRLGFLTVVHQRTVEKGPLLLFYLLLIYRLSSHSLSGLPLEAIVRGGGKTFYVVFTVNICSETCSLPIS
jgi:hypothetical protein